MLKLLPLDKNVEIIKDYMQISPVSFCDLSIGTKYLWRDTFKIFYAVQNQTLIMAESCPDYDLAFYYPIGNDVQGALESIEEYCKRTGQVLRFCCIDNDLVADLSNRYRVASIYSFRDWSDYIYDAQKFKSFTGKKYSGQRNHINKFRKLYPNYEFAILTKRDLDDVREFLAEYERVTEISLWTAKQEEKNVFDLIENLDRLNQLGGVIRVDGKIVALSVGEIVGDTLIVHVEKALKAYQGAYPLMANEFAKAFVNNDVKYINREEDCGDNGLRTSKLQYHPILIKEKNIVIVKTLFDKLPTSLSIKTERLTITEIREEDKADYARLYLDDGLNKYWGYDYHEDLNGNTPSADYFYSFQQSLKDKKEEFSFAVRLNGKMIGELVLHNFGYDASVEMGFRFFKEYQGKGYAIESASALKDWTIKTLSPSEIKSRCFKQNLPSASLIKRLGLSKTSEDKTHYYFSQKIKL